MLLVFNKDQFLTYGRKSVRGFFTLLLILLTFLTPAKAVESGSNPSSAISLTGMSAPTAFDSQEQHRRLSLLVNYLRQEGTQILPELPEAIRLPARVALNDITALKDEIGITPAMLEQERAIAAIVEPVSNWMAPPEESTQEAYWLSPNYHHKGFLPLHDAMVLGVNARQQTWNGRLQLDTHPFFGQNWHSADNYWGIETTLSLFHAQPSNKPSWGKISLRYTYGDASMMDQRPGFDMHTELRFTDEVTLNAGVRQGDAIGLGNYVMLRWKLANFGQP